jgi:TetR/AcrR family transcriptional regulator, ethionamide resistance regulator
VASGEAREGATTAKRAAVQAAVLRATEDLLAEGGSYSDLGVERIATRAGISRTAFYFYFRDKRDLLLRLTEDVTGLLYAEAAIWWSGDGDPAEQIGQALTNIAALYREHAVLLRAIVEVSTYDEEFGAFWRGIVGRFVEASRQRIEREQQTGAALPGAAHPTAFALTWMTERAFYQQLVQPDIVDDVVGALVPVWTRAVYGR